MKTKPTLLLAAGTSEARDLAVRLLEAGYRLELTVVSDYGEDLLQESLADFPEETYSIHTGRLDTAGFQELIREQDIRLIADATHPYATVAGETLREVAKRCRIPYLRYQREIASSEALRDAEDAQLHVASNSAEAAEMAAALLKDDPELICFLTIGSKDVHVFTDKIPAEHIIARVLPVVNSLERMEAAGLSPANIIGRQGPFSKDENLSDMSRYERGVLVTKASGKRGGYEEKIAAAQELGWPVIVIAPPREDEAVSPEDFLNEVADALKTAPAADPSQEFLPTHVPRVILSAPRTGSGKTAITAALLLALRIRGVRTKAFKIGSDAVDATLHEAVSGDRVSNLDTVLYTPETNEAMLRFYAQDKDLTLIEGAMGLYDGQLGSNPDLPDGSAARLAAETQTPVILVVDATARAQSLIPEIKGMVDYHPDVHIAGVILNRISENLYDILKPEIESVCGIPVLAGLPDDPNFALPDPISELLLDDNTEDFIDWRDEALQLFESADFEQFLKIAESAPDLDRPGVLQDPFLRKVFGPEQEEEPTADKPKIAYAQDLCFSRDDKENIRVLEAQGFEVMEFSPLHDDDPFEADLLWLGESDLLPYLSALNANVFMSKFVRDWYQAGKPLVALGESYAWLTGQTATHRRFGYREMTAQNDGLLLQKGQTMLTREFTRIGGKGDKGDFIVRRRGTKEEERTGEQTAKMFLSYGRVSLLSEPKLSERLKELLT